MSTDSSGGSSSTRRTEPAAVTTFLFTDIEGSTRLWEEAPDRMRPALARHDAIARLAVEGHRGPVVKMTGDALYAAFDDSLDAVDAALQLQQALANQEATDGVALRVRLADALGTLAEVHRAEGNIDAAEPLYEEALAIYRQLGDRESTGIMLFNLALVSIGRGSGMRARGMLLEAQPVAEELGLRRLGHGVLGAAAGLVASLGEWERATRLHAASATQRDKMGLHRDPADEAFLLPLIARAREALDAPALAAAEAAGQSLSYEEAMAEARAWLESISIRA